MPVFLYTEPPRTAVMKYYLILLVVLFRMAPCFSQAAESDLNMFGYFQNQFSYEDLDNDAGHETTFMVQQLNLFLQKDLAARWASFVNFELVNSFSSSSRFGDFKLEEAWVRYRSSPGFNLKLGLQIPIFNNLNEIKNRTPILPYIIRPLVYETSFGELFNVEEFAPARAYVQAFGFLRRQSIKFDYAAYVGNSPHLNDDPDYGPTGRDTTDTFLVGGRVGVRYDDLKLGISGTVESVSPEVGIPLRFSEELRASSLMLERIARYRFGSDLSYHAGRYFFESELIAVRYSQADGVDNGISTDKTFFYATIGFRLSEPALVFLSYWTLQQEINLGAQSESMDQDIDIDIPNVGASYLVNDRITLKTHMGYVRLRTQLFDRQATTTSFTASVAISVFF
jgi:hypothetical protein